MKFITLLIAAFTTYCADEIQKSLDSSPEMMEIYPPITPTLGSTSLHLQPPSSYDSGDALPQYTPPTPPHMTIELGAPTSSHISTYLNQDQLYRLSNKRQRRAQRIHTRISAKETYDYKQKLLPVCGCFILFVILIVGIGITWDLS